MAKKIKGNRDGDGGRNESYNIPGRGNVSRRKLVNEVKKGMHPKHSVYERGGEEYIRSNPDNRKKNNVNE